MQNVLCVYFQTLLKTNEDYTASVARQRDHFQNMLHEEKVRKISLEGVCRVQSVTLI